MVAAGRGAMRWLSAPPGLDRVTGEGTLVDLWSALGGLCQEGNIITG